MKLRRTLIAFGAAATLTLTACGNATDSTDGGDSSSDDTTVSGNASAALTQDNFASSVSDAQADAKSTHIELSVDAMGEEIDGSGDVEMASDDPKDAKMSIEIGVPQLGDMEMRLIEGVLYMKMGSFTEDKFVEMDLNSDDNPLGKSFGDMSSKANPNAMVEGLADSLKDFEKTDETEEMDGVEATKYVITIDGKDIEGAMGQQGSALAGGTMDVPDEIKADVWVGEDDLLRKIEADVETGSTPISFEIEFSDWGDPVDVEAPSDSEITESSMLDGTTSM